VSRPPGPPIGLILTRTAKTVSRAFDDTLAAVGGSLPIWLIVLSLKTRHLGNQRELAQAVGIQGATMTHHLNAMETGGLITRRRDPANRRVHQVQLTDRGESLFQQLAGAAIAHDQRLRAASATTNSPRWHACSTAWSTTSPAPHPTPHSPHRQTRTFRHTHEHTTSTDHRAGQRLQMSTSAANHIKLKDYQG
jgi:MarR family transcriptional regulator, transcriptional regulator for hemolysin